MSIGSVTVRAGWIAVLVLVLRFVLGMAALIALVSMMRFPELLKGLEQMGVPRLLTTQLRFLDGYLFVLIDQAMHMRDRRARWRHAWRGPVSALGRSRGGQIGVLFLRTLELAERIHLAMVARGFEGEAAPADAAQAAGGRYAVSAGDGGVFDRRFMSAELIRRLFARML